MRRRRLKNAGLLAECDKLVQEIACLDWCAVSGYPAEVGHHLIPRANMFFRHDLRNIVPLTDYDHTKQWCAPHVSPDDFADVMSTRWPEQWEWAQANRHGYHKAPDRDALLETRERLRAFLALGQPFIWSEA